MLISMQSSSKNCLSVRYWIGGFLSIGLIGILCKVKVLGKIIGLD